MNVFFLYIYENLAKVKMKIYVLEKNKIETCGLKEWIWLYIKCQVLQGIVICVMQKLKIVIHFLKKKDF